MIDKEMQEHIKNYVAKQEGQDYPCGNQIVKRGIILKDRSRIPAFEQTYPSFMLYRQSFGENRYINPRTEELWITKSLCDNCRGYRFYKAIIDSTIDMEVFSHILFNCMAHYCCSVEFF